VLVVGANLTQDRLITLPALVPGAVLRADNVQVRPGGKPVNVARVAAGLGTPPTLVANLPGRLGALAGDALRTEGLDVVGVATPGELRSATIVTEADGRVTVLNEPGPVLTSGDVEGLLSAYDDTLHSRSPRVVVVPGSLPPGAEPAFYVELVTRGHRHGARVLVDAGGPALLAALDAGADLVKPNVAEAEWFLRAGRPGDHELVDDRDTGTRERCLEAAATLVARGAVAALVSGGRHGAALHAEGRSTWFPTPPVRAVNAVGAGDALVAGVAVALDGGRPLRDAVGFGMVVAAESVTHATPGTIDRAAVAAMRKSGAVPTEVDA